jgi:signal transduction histidine kinase
MKSLASRLHLGLGIAMLTLMLAFWWLGYDALQGSAKAFVAESLDHCAEALVGKLAIINKHSGKLLEVDELAPVYHQPYSGHYYVLLLASGEKVLSRSLWDQDLEVPPLAKGQTAEWRVPGPEGQRLQVRAHGYRIQGQDMTLAVAQDLTPLEHEVTQFQWRFGLLALVGFLLMTVVRHRIVHRVFQSLNPVYANIEQWEHGQAERLTEEVPVEIQPLVRKINHLLSLLAERLDRSRKAAGNLSHGLKVPLALLRQSLETDDPPRAQLKAWVEQIRELAERELRRAQLAGSGPPGRRFFPAEDLPALVLLLERMHPAKNLAIEYDIRIRGSLTSDRDDMLELLGVLMDNACKWARSRVSCTVMPWEQGFLLRVEDDGPGCDEPNLERIRVRGARLDEQVSGHGLGLSIAGDIVAIHGGDLVLGCSPTLGGFLAEARIPAMPGSRPVSRSGMTR